MGDKTLLDRVIDLECAMSVLKEEFCRFKVDSGPTVPIESGGLRLAVEGLVERARAEDEKRVAIAERMRKARAGRGKRNG